MESAASMVKVLKWFVLILAVGLTVLLVIQGMGGSWVGPGMAGPMLLFFFVPMLFRADKQMGGGAGSKAFRGAPIGMGTVVSSSPTGLTINQQPQVQIMLDVVTQDGQTFRGVLRQVLAVTELALVQPGAQLPVRYVPGSTDGKIALATDATQEETQAAFTQIQLATGQITQQQLLISQQGTVAQAVVLAMQPTGELRSGRSVIRLTLRVTRPDGTTFDVVQDKPLLPEVLPQVQPGMVIQVRYLPHDESELVIAAAARR